MAPHQLHLRLLAMVMCLIASIACDDNDSVSSRPTGPTFINRLSGPAAGSLSTTSVISGHVSRIDSFVSTVPTDQTDVTSPRVGIAPLGISTVVGRDGNFTLAGVPPGTVTLVFTDRSVSAAVLLPNVGVNQLIVLNVVMNGGVATIESDRRTHR